MHHNLVVKLYFFFKLGVCICISVSWRSDDKADWMQPMIRNIDIFLTKRLQFRKRLDFLYPSSFQSLLDTFVRYICLIEYSLIRMH